MVNAQKWLDKNYSKPERTRFKELDISNKNLEGRLDLRDFANLERLICVSNEITELDLSTNEKLTFLNLSWNQIVEVEFLNHLPNSSKLTFLSLNNNNISPTNLSIFSRFTNLEVLWIGTNWAERTNKGMYNFFYGSLEPLQSLTKLKGLDIANTDINSGLEYLSADLERIYCSANLRKNCQAKQIVEQLTPYDYDEKDEDGWEYYNYQGWRKNNSELIITRWERETYESREKIKELEEKLATEHEMTNESMIVAQRWRERQIEEIKEEKAKELEELKVKIINLERKLAQSQPQIQISPK